MRLLLTLCVCFLVLPLGAVPSLTDLDSWQIPEEPAPQQPAPKPTPKPKPAASTGPEIVIEMTDTAYAPVAKTRDSNEIAVLSRSAEQLAKSLAGKSRFYVLFNANQKAATDTMVEALDGTRYALLLYGQEGKNFRQLLFKYWQDQPLVAVAENKQDQLAIFRDYGVNLGLTEADFRTAYPQAQPKTIEDAKDHTLYHVYKFSDTFLVSFQNDQPVARFTAEKDLASYTDQLQHIEPPQETETEKPQKRSIYAPVIPVAPRPKFSDLVEQGTFLERMQRAQYNQFYDEFGSPDRYADPYDSPRGTNQYDRPRSRSNSDYRRSSGSRSFNKRR